MSSPGPEIREYQSGWSSTNDIVLTTGGGVLATDTLLIIHGWDYYNLSNGVSPTPGAWSTTASSGNLSSGHPHMKVWTKQATSGVNTITVVHPTSDVGHHAHLLVLTGNATPGAGQGNYGGASVSHVMPSVVTLSQYNLLVSATIGLTNGSSTFDYTAPVGMTKIGETDRDTWSTMGVFLQLIDATPGATGTRTAIAGMSVEFAAISLAVEIPAPVGPGSSSSFLLFFG